MSVAPVLIVVLSGLELQFNNILFRTSREFETLVMFPISWRHVVVAKNLAAIVLMILFLILVSMALLYFYPDSLSLGRVGNVGIYSWTILFPLIHVGNMRSIQNPRRESGLRFTDFIEALWMTGTVAIISIPYFLFMRLMDLPILCFAYGIATLFFWYCVSVPKAATLIGKETIKLCAGR